MGTILLSTYKSRVRNKLKDASYSSSNLTQFADETNKDICNTYRWPFMESVYEGTLTTGTSTYEFTAADFQTPVSMTVVSPNNDAIFLKYVPHEQFYQDYPDPEQLTDAPPEIWTVFGTNFIVGPAAPDEDYTLSLRYIKSPTTIDGDSDTFDVPDDFAEIVTLGMYRRALQEDDEWELAREVQREYDIQLRKMADRLNRRQTAEPVVIPTSRSAVTRVDW